MPTLVRAVFPGTFDPITLGHEDMLRRACALFGEVIVAVAMAHHKKTLFTLDERLAITRQALADMPKVRVEPFEGLVTEFAVAHHAQVMVRGLRSGTPDLPAAAALGAALEAALRTWGFAVTTDREMKDQNAIRLAYVLAPVDGQILARLTTGSLEIGRIYATTGSGATPASPISVMQRG